MDAPHEPTALCHQWLWFGHARGSGGARTAGPSSKGLVFLTRGGCVNTTAMENLDEALKALGVAGPLRSRRAPHEGAIGITNTMENDQGLALSTKRAPLK